MLRYYFKVLANIGVPKKGIEVFCWIIFSKNYILDFIFLMVKLFTRFSIKVKAQKQVLFLNSTQTSPLLCHIDFKQLDHTLCIWIGTQFTQRYIHVADRKKEMKIVSFCDFERSSHPGLSGKNLKYIQSQLPIHL